MLRATKLIWVAGLAAGLICAVGFQSKSASKSAAPTFKDVKPIFKDCVMCHSGERPKAGIDFSTYASIMDGGDDGPVVKKGSAKDSLLVKALRGAKGVRKMPPFGDPLPEAKIVLLEKWITGGAKP